MTTYRELLESRDVEKVGGCNASTNLSLREYADFLQACQMLEEDPKVVLGQLAREYVLKTEVKLSLKKS